MLTCLSEIPPIFTPSYFIITSAIGIGHSNIYPKTTWGQVLLLALYAMIIIYVPQNVLILYRLWNADKTNRDRSRLDNKTKKRHIILTGYCTYRDVASLLVYQWREDFVTDDYLVAVVSPTLTMAEFRHSPYWKHRFVMRVQFFKGTVFNHNDLLRSMFMSASDVVFIPDRLKDFAARDKETVIALVSLENSFITNTQYFEYIQGLPEKVGISGEGEAKDRARIHDMALFATTGRKPRVFTSIYSGVVAVPQYSLPVKINLPVYLKHALIATELLCPGSYPLLHNLLLMHTRVGAARECQRRTLATPSTRTRSARAC
ncbi:hypothetical protein BLSTO_02421 [Blastocystis sp. subtype 1]